MQTLQVGTMDSFRILLNEISHELTDEELQSLIHIYNVPGSVRKEINNGLALFNYMIKQDYISRENIENLHRLMRKMRPARKDLVRKVENYIEKEFKTSDYRLMLSDLSESWEQIDNNTRGSRSVAVPVHNEVAACNIDCGYENCLCRCQNVPYTPIILLLLLFIIGTAVILHDRIENDGYIKGMSKSAIIFILITEIILLFVVILFRVRGAIHGGLNGQGQGYTVLRNPTVQAPRKIDASTSIGGLSSADTLTNTGSSIKADTRPARIPTSVPKRSRNRPSSESAVFSSLTSGEPGSISTYGGTMSAPKDSDVTSGPEA